MSLIKPLLAKDVNEDKMTFPCVLQYKRDGVRLLVQEGTAYARSLKKHENKYTTALFSNSLFNGIDSEATSGEDSAADALCRRTSGDMRRIEGTPDIHLWCFDYVTEETKNLPYSTRFALLAEKVDELNKLGFSNIHLVEYNMCSSKAEYEEFKQKAISTGYEGVIIRDPNLPHKEGRSSSTKAHVHRWKPFKDDEGLVVGLTEGFNNNNEKLTNELGKSYRQSLKENKTNGGFIGSLQVKLLKDLVEVGGAVVTKAGEIITISAGEMPMDDKIYLWNHKDEILNDIVTFSWFAFGNKDLPRFANFKSIRSKVNL